VTGGAIFFVTPGAAIWYPQRSPERANHDLGISLPVLKYSG
jgi:hypothetical protein